MILPSKLKAPIIFKESEESKDQLKQLMEFHKTAPDSIKKQVERDIKMLSYGISGEENVLFELKNSFVPMLVLHDLHLEYEDLTAQIDYLVISPKINLVIECKNLIGDIEVTSNGEFIRSFEFGGRKVREGIYSPITQNQRHLDIIRRLRLDLRTNFISRALFEKGFHDRYKSVVVLANPKSVINMKYAKKELKSQIIRADQLVEFIKNIDNNSSEPASSTKDMYELANFFLEKHTPRQQDYTLKYLANLNEKPQEVPTQEPMPHIPQANLEDLPVYKALKEYRYNKSRDEGIKPYFIFNNAQMEELIRERPRTKSELTNIPGFGEVKAEKYGQDILSILGQYK